MSSNEIKPFEEWPLHSQMMYHFFVTAFSDRDEDFNRGLDILKSGKIDVFDHDNTLFRELNGGGRWMAPRCRAICNEIMKLTGMTMDDILTHIGKIYHHDMGSFNWTEYVNCDCEGVCMKSHCTCEGGLVR